MLCIEIFAQEKPSGVSQCLYSSLYLALAAQNLSMRQAKPDFLCQWRARGTLRICGTSSEIQGGF